MSSILEALKKLEAERAARTAEAQPPSIIVPLEQEPVEETAPPVVESAAPAAPLPVTTKHLLAFVSVGVALVILASGITAWVVARSLAPHAGAISGPEKTEVVAAVSSNPPAPPTAPAMAETANTPATRDTNTIAVASTATPVAQPPVPPATPAPKAEPNPSAAAMVPSETPERAIVTAATPPTTATPTPQAGARPAEQDHGRDVKVEPPRRNNAQEAKPSDIPRDTPVKAYESKPSEKQEAVLPPQKTDADIAPATAQRSETAAESNDVSTVHKTPTPTPSDDAATNRAAIAEPPAESQHAAALPTATPDSTSPPEATRPEEKASDVAAIEPSQPTQAASAPGTVTPSPADTPTANQQAAKGKKGENGDAKQPASAPIKKEISAGAVAETKPKEKQANPSADSQVSMEPKAPAPTRLASAAESYPRTTPTLEPPASSNTPEPSPTSSAAPDITRYPPLRGSDRVRYGLENLRINMIREPTPTRPEGHAIINLNKVFVGETIPGTPARLIGVVRRGIAIEIETTGERFFISN